jgi:hypothetical protein
MYFIVVGRFYYTILYMLPICYSPNILKLKKTSNFIVYNTQVLEYYTIDRKLQKFTLQNSSYNLFINIEHLNYVYNVMLLYYNFFLTKKPKNDLKFVSYDFVQNCVYCNVM